MKGIVIQTFGGPEVLQYKELPDPVPEGDQVLIKVAGTSVNYADIKARQGQYHLRGVLPFTPGLEVTGRILDTGPNVSNFRPGDRVIAFPATGGYAELAVADEQLTFKIPESIDAETAAAFPLVMGISTHLLFFAAGVKQGDNLLIHAAAGGVGSAIIQIAKQLRLSSIIGTSSNPAKIDKILANGANIVIDPESSTFIDQLFAHTNNRGADIILNPIGGTSLERDLQCLAPFGRLISFGNMGENEGSGLNLDSMYTTNKSILGVSFGHYRKNRPEHVRQVMDKAIRLLTEDGVSLPIAKSLPLQEAAQAHLDIEGRSLTGKVILMCN